MENEINNKEKKGFLMDAAKYGLLVGLLSVILLLITYVMNPLLMVKWWLGILFFFISIVAVVVAALDLRRKMGGFMIYKDALVIVFVIFAASSVITSSFNYVLFTVIDPELPVVMKEAIVDQTTSMMESMNADQEAIDKAITQIEQEDYALTPGKAFKGFMISLLISFIISLIIAIFVKKNSPMFQDAE